MLVNRERAMEVMEREGLDALVAVTPNNVLYLSDFDTDFLYDVPWVACAILPRDPDIPPCLVATEIEAAVLVQRPDMDAGPALVLLRRIRRCAEGAHVCGRYPTQGRGP